MSNFIAMGTTPTIAVTIKDNNGDPFDFNLIDTTSFRVYFKQDGGRTVISKLGSAIVVKADESKVQTYLTQEDTLKFVKGTIDIEVRWLFNAILPNEDKKAGKTVILDVPIGTVLKREVVKNELQ